MVLPITPVAKPRMTRSDTWKKRPCVVKYWDYKDQLRRLLPGYKLPNSYKVVFGIPIPKNYSKNKKREMLGRPHLRRPDTDNLIKAFQDALLGEDSAVWRVDARKIWAIDGFIEVEENEDSQLEGF